MFAAGIPEAETVIYGKVLNTYYGYPQQVTAGTLVWRIKSTVSGRAEYEYSTALGTLEGGYSYKLELSQEAILAAGELVTPGAVPLSAQDVQYDHLQITVDGLPARIVAPARSFLLAAQARRGQFLRIDLEIVAERPDSDGDGMPDFWEDLYGLDKSLNDASGDADGDGLTNLAEFRRGTNPKVGNQVPSLLATTVVAWESARTQLRLAIVDTDTPPASLTVTVTQPPAGVSLELRGVALGVGDTFTWQDLNDGKVLVRHEPDGSGSLDFSVTLKGPDHAAVPATLHVEVYQPVATDGTDALYWTDAAEHADQGETVVRLVDRSGNGHDAALASVDPWGTVFYSTSAYSPSGRKVLKFWRTPYAEIGDEVVPSGDSTVFAVFKSTGGESQSLLATPQFDFGVTGDDHPSHPNEVCFATPEGTVFGNRNAKREWTLAAAITQDGKTEIELDGLWRGGPNQLPGENRMSSAPLVGGRAFRDVDPVQNSPSVTIDKSFVGLLAEMLVFNKTLSDQRKWQVYTYLLSKWYGYVVCDLSRESQPLEIATPSAPQGQAGIDASLASYRSQFVPAYGRDHQYILIGGDADDVVRGGFEDDILIGGPGNDVLQGKGGADVFVVTAGDTVYDFIPADGDVLYLAPLLNGSSRNLADYLSLANDGTNSTLLISSAGNGGSPDVTIALRNIVLRNSDLARLWLAGNLQTGSIRPALELNVTATDPEATEVTGDQAVFTVTFSNGLLPRELRLPIQTGGTATLGTDYRLEARTYDAATDAYSYSPVTTLVSVALKPGDSSVQLRVIPVADSVSEPAESITLTVLPKGELYDLGASPRATVTLSDGLDVVRISAPVATAREEGLAAGALLLTRSGSLDVPLTVSLGIQGSASNGVDFDFIPSEVTIAAGQTELRLPVVPRADTLTEPTEYVECFLSASPRYTVAGAATATVAILDYPLRVTIEAAEPIAERTSGIPGLFLLRRTGVLNSTMDVALRIGGTAGNGKDYEWISRVVSFAPGQSTIPILVRPKGAAGSGTAQTVELEVEPGSGYTVAHPWAARVAIVDETSTYGSWARAAFAGAPAGTDTGAAADADQDGWPNLAEYAFGAAPLVAEASCSCFPRVACVDGFLQVSFEQPLRVTDVRPVAEVSTDLVTWWHDPLDPFLLSADLTGAALRLTYRCQTPLAEAAGALFLRVQLERTQTPSAPSGLQPCADLILGSEPLAWVSDGAAPWRADPIASGTIGYAARSGAIGHGQQSVLSTVVQGPGRVVFRWHVSSRAGADVLGFLVDGQQVAAISGEVPWTPVSQPVTAGGHELAWRYTRDASTSGGADSGWVTGFALIPTAVPTPVADTAVTFMNTAVTVDVLANDSDPDGDRLSIVGSVNGGHGKVLASPGGGLTYTPDRGFYGTDTFTYTVSDGNGGLATATVSVTVTWYEFHSRGPWGFIPPNTQEGTRGVSTPLSTSLLVPLLGTVQDLRVSLDILHLHDGKLRAYLTSPEGTRVALFENLGEDQYNFTGTVLSDVASRSIAEGNAPFTGVYRPVMPLEAFRGEQARGEWRLEVDVDPVIELGGWLCEWGLELLLYDTTTANPPLARDDQGATAAGGVASIEVLRNDVSADGGTLTVVAATAGRHGTTAVVPETGTVTYTPEPAFVGTDSFTYTVSDLAGQTDRGTVRVEVYPQGPSRSYLTEAATGIVDGQWYYGAVLPCSVAQVGTVADIAVVTYIDHPFAADLAVYLVSPAGTRVPVFDNPQATGTGPWATAFSDEAAVGVLQDPALAGSAYRPVGRLGAIRGENARGDWRLEVYDRVANGGFVPAPFGGAVYGWELVLVFAEFKAADDWAETDTDTEVNLDVLANDAISDPAAVSLSILQPPAFGTVQALADNTLTYSPNPGAAGTDTLVYGIADGVGGISQATASVWVHPPALLFQSTDTPQPIPDNDVATGAVSRLQVDAAGTVARVRVLLSIDHPFEHDLYAYLISPSGTQVMLFRKVGLTSNQHGFSNTLLDDRADKPIGDGVGPFTGAYRPQQPLSALRGEPLQGVWRLVVQDAWRESTGTLTGWAIEIVPE